MEKTNKADRFREALLADLTTAQRLILEENVDIHRYYYHKYPNKTFLEFAIAHGNLRAVRFLLEQGVSLNPNGSLNSWPLLAAIRAVGKTTESYDILELLLKKGAGCNVRVDGGGATVFHLALEFTSLRCIQMLLDYGADVGIVDFYGKTALHYAVCNSQVDVIQLLLDQGLDVERGDSDGWSALHLAVVFENPNGCELLLRNGANVHRRIRDDATPLFLAAMRQNMDDVVRVLLHYGANVTDKYRGNSILQTAMTQSDSDTIMLLIQQMVKMVHLNLSINECDQKIIDGNDSYRKYYETCSKELRDMKEVKFYKNVSLHEVFMESEKVVSRFARNEDLVDALKGGAYKDRFPLNFPCLEKKFLVEVERQQLRKTAAKVLSDLFKLNDPYHLVNQKIFNYLRDEDLKFLVPYRREKPHLFTRFAASIHSVFSKCVIL